MKKHLILTLMAACILGISGCGRQDVAAVPSVSVTESIPDTSEQENSWTEQDVISMFSKIKDTNSEYMGCVLMPDHASKRIGAVLFRDSKEGTSNVAFFDADGYFQLCSTYAKLSNQPDFTYLGDGTVTFKVEDESGTVSLYTITVSIQDGDVFFKAEEKDAANNRN